MSEHTLTLFDLAPGKVIADRYRILRPNRHGGMATTFVVNDAEGDEELEMQVFPAGLFESLDQARDFAGVLDAWKRIESPAVARVREVEVRVDGALLLVTDLPPGTSLRDWLTVKERMNAADASRLGLRLLEALELIHSAGQVHGDIKPHTVHLAGDDPVSALLVDGGITSGLWSAKHLGDKTALIGTPFYAPVEQFGGESPDVQSDLYNLATVLYELVTGVVPWPGSSFLEVFQAKLEKRPVAMRTRAPEVRVPAAFESAIAPGLFADRRERFASARAFREALESADLGE